MKILLHVCCANCAIYPSQKLRKGGEKVVGYFFNPNIHPYQEYQKRLDTLKQYAGQSGLEVLYRNEYLLEEFLRNVAQNPEERCRFCYTTRLESAAREAKKEGFDAFSTTLLYSIYQNHDLIRRTGERLAEATNLPFYYEDFRRGWKEGVDLSRSMGLYRQKYCGCIYSEKERFFKPGK